MTLFRLLVKLVKLATFGTLLLLSGLFLTPLAMAYDLCRLATTGEQPEMTEFMVTDIWDILKQL